ncbi:DUF4238 domain-containing protein [Sulfitobacter guttiformis]|uniref:Uncharacterized protein DUF4238 n=1 Tax=Sulfitobacter guttiformis TaxID=74349 RepID=A0A420DJW9_9RHOB|nr:DUF4238 domain-containing protein [Sulfitobacter guttiformis]KIN71672.1 DUF4238 domain containing protein [Sulfitobacter guttiformis KCTC 32187]RKE94499.1 uncharacterized protein DUF4238 [Sulfitobacter guttiformis]
MKKPKIPKNHHYVPQALLRNFCFEGEAVWYHYKNGKKTAPIRRNVEGIFSDYHYYTIEEDGKKSAHVETGFYQKVDDLFARIDQEAKNIFDSGSIPHFSGDSLNSLYHIFSIFAKRTKDFIGNLEGNQLVRLTDDLDEEASTALRLFLSQKSDEEKEQMVKNARIRAQAPESKKVLAGLDGHKAAWATAPVNKQFILGSYPIIRLDDGVKNRLGSLEVELWIPMSPHRMLGLVHPDKAQSKRPILLSPAKVREISEYIFRNSTELASANFDLLASLMKRRS